MYRIIVLVGCMSRFHKFPSAFKAKHLIIWQSLRNQCNCTLMIHICEGFTGSPNLEHCRELLVVFLMT